MMTTEISVPPKAPVDLKQFPIGRIEEFGAVLIGIAALISAEIAQEQSAHILGLTPRQMGWAAVGVFSLVWLGRFAKGIADEWRNFEQKPITIGIGTLGSASQVLAAGIAAVATQLATAHFAGLTAADYGKLTAFSAFLLFGGRIAQGAAQILGPIITYIGGRTEEPVTPPAGLPLVLPNDPPMNIDPPTDPAPVEESDTAPIDEDADFGVDEEPVGGDEPLPTPPIDEDDGTEDMGDVGTEDIGEDTDATDGGLPDTPPPVNPADEVNS